MKCTWVKITGGVLFGILVLIGGTGAWGWKHYSEERILLSHVWNTEKETYLVVFQNHMELRPTGGYIGNFAEVTVSNGKLVDYTLYNTNDFDYAKPGKPAPAPLKDILGISKQQLRDSNWNPDFYETSRVIRTLYHKEGGDKDIAGVIGVNSQILPLLMEYAGPVNVEGIDTTLTSDNVLWEVQKELNFGYIDNPDRSRANRKRPFKQLVRTLEERIRTLSWREKKNLGMDLYRLAEEKQILFAFENTHLQQQVEELRWAGRMRPRDDGYVYVVDANLGALKTDMFMERELDISETSCKKTRDICGELTITYTNTAEESTKLSNAYRSYTRVYLPDEAYVDTVKGIHGEASYTRNKQTKETGFVVKVPIDAQQKVKLSYTRPKDTQSPHQIFIQKQPGITELPVSVIYGDRSVEKTLRKDHLFTVR